MATPTAHQGFDKQATACDRITRDVAETYSAKLRISASVTASTGAASARAVSAVTIRSTLRPMVAKTCAINEPCYTKTISAPFSIRLRYWYSWSKTHNKHCLDCLAPSG